MKNNKNIFLNNKFLELKKKRSRILIAKLTEKVPKRMPAGFPQNVSRRQGEKALGLRENTDLPPKVGVSSRRNHTLRKRSSVKPSKLVT